ncbi:hypothetical protein D3C72_1220110 [compost metagenome]
MVQIEKGRRLVEKNYIRLLGQRHGDPGALALAAGKAVDCFFRQFGHAGHGQRLFHRAGVFLAPLLQKSLMRITSPGDEIENRKPFRRMVLLRQHAELFRHLLGRVAEDIATVEKNVAPRGPMQAGERAEKCGFSGAVGTKQNGEVVRRDIDGHVRKHRRVAIGKLDCLRRKACIRAYGSHAVVQIRHRLNELPPELLMTVVVKYIAFEKAVFAGRFEQKAAVMG